jgi:hypothetical protein
MRRCYRCNLSLEDEAHWHGLHADCFDAWFEPSGAVGFQDVSAKRQSSQSPPVDSSFFHGKYRKYSAKLGGRPYILKAQEEEYPELPATEYLCNQIFQRLGIRVPQFHLLLFEGHPCFVTRNFIEGNASNLVHLYHLFGEAPYNCEHAWRIIGEKTGRISAQEEFACVTLADSLIGNNDRHGRNLGLIQTSSGYELAPFYDNPSYLAIESHRYLNAQHNPYGTIHTQDCREPSMKDYVREWRRLGLNRIVDQFRKTVQIDEIRQLVIDSHLSSIRQQALLRLIQRRYEELWS